MATDQVADKLAIDGGKPVTTKTFGARWLFGQEERDNLLEVIDKCTTGNWFSAGMTERFEDEFARRHGVRYACSTDSGSAALHAAVAAVRLEPGDEIITTPITDIGTVQGIMLQNGVPVFCDWDSDTFNMDPNDIEHRITERTKAIIAVHWAGNPCDMDAIMDIARRHDLIVIEDCAQAHFAEYKGQLVGTIGDMGCYSLGGKLITAAGGGMFITDNEKYARIAKGFANKGSEYDEGLRNSLRPTSERTGSLRGFAFLGDFHRMSPLQSAIGVAQLGRLDQTMERRGRVAEIVDDMIHELPGVTRPKFREGDVISQYTFVFKVEEDMLGVSPAQFNEALKAEGVDSSQGALAGQPLYRFPVFAEERTYGQSRYPFVDEQGNRRADYNAVTLPVAERELPKIVSFISHSRHTDEYAADIGNAIRKVALHYASRK
jgi:dTDP-4-amino-4,6-dideoxygalactose transaminase